jgi:hypothetical protein
MTTALEATDKDFEQMWQMLKRILHDWDEGQAVRILETVGGDATRRAGCCDRGVSRGDRRAVVSSTHGPLT